MDIENYIAEKKLNIWTYWESIDSRPMPSYLQLCLNAIKKTNPSANVRLVTPINIKQYIPHIEIPLNDIKLRDHNRNPISLKTDYLRVRLLHDHGGLWLDIDCIPLRNLEGIVSQYLNNYSFVGMRKTSKEKPYFTNNFMASRAKGTIISKYLKKITEHIEKKIQKKELFKWSEIGSDMLTPIVEASDSDSTLVLDENLIHPFDFKEHLLLESPLDHTRINSILSEKINEKTHCLMLYNALISERFKSLSKEEVLLSNTIIGHTLKKSINI